MGTLFFVVCRDCNIKRDLDKFYDIRTEVETRENAEAFSEEIKENSFRAGLLISFLWKHKLHNCFVCDEHYETYDQSIYEIPEEQVDFWKPATAEGLK